MVLTAIPTAIDGRLGVFIKRELDRHRSPEGRYLPRTADHDARQQRSRPRACKLAANITLRRLVQSKLNRCWSRWCSLPYGFLTGKDFLTPAYGGRLAGNLQSRAPHCGHRTG
jgi:hypothetical protein